MTRFAKFGALLLLTMLGSGCAKNMVLVTDTESLCKDWPPVLVQKGDRMTNETAETVLESNEARKVWGCKAREREAA